MVNLLLTSALDLFNQYKSIRDQTSNSGKALLGPSSSRRQRKTMNSFSCCFPACLLRGCKLLPLLGEGRSVFRGWAGGVA